MNQIQKVKLTLIYTSALGRTVRLLGFFFLMAVFLSQLQSRILPQTIFGYLLLFFMLELFMHYKIGNMRLLPPLHIDKKTPLFQSYTHALLMLSTSAKSPMQLIEKLLRRQEIKDFLQKLEITPSEVEMRLVTEENLFQTCEELVLTADERIITTLDVFVSYLILTDPETKLFFKKEVHKDDVVALWSWSRKHVLSVEYPAKRTVQFDGEGYADGLINGWTPETKKYTRQLLSPRTRPHITGREKEYALLCETLVKREANNVVLIGNVGVGKEQLVQAFIYDSYQGRLSKQLNHKRILELLVGELTAGATAQGQLEERLEAIIKEVAHAVNVMLYIPDIEHILGSASFGLDLSGAIMPYLKNAMLPIIATMTKDAYKKYLEDKPISQQFSLVSLDEPTDAQLLIMLLAKTEEVEAANGVLFTFQAIKEASLYGDVYAPDEYEPGGAVRLLLDTLTHVLSEKRQKPIIIGKTDIVTLVKSATTIPLGNPSEEEETELLHLDEKLHARVIGQDQAVTKVAQAMERLRVGTAKRKKPISFLFLGPTGVGKTETAKALAEAYFGGENKMIRLDMSEFSQSDALDRLLGRQGDAHSGVLTEKVRDNPYTLILLDEFEKASPEVQNLFLQVLDDGRITDASGKTMSFVNDILIATSNAGSEIIREQVAKNGAIDDQFKQVLLDSLQQQGIFKPELLNRFDEVITYLPLSNEISRQVTKLLLETMKKMYLEKDVTVTYDENCVTTIVSQGVDPEYGARPLARYINDTVETMIAEKMLRNEIQRGDTVALTSNNNVIQLSVQKGTM